MGVYEMAAEVGVWVGIRDFLGARWISREIAFL